jgi:hypothetical protein
MSWVVRTLLMQVYTDNRVAEDNVLYVKSGTVTYSSILIKVFAMLEHATSIGARWLLKTDDDAFVNIPQTVQVCTHAAENAGYRSLAKY